PKANAEGAAMIVPLLFAFGLICATVLIHALGTWEAVAYLARVWSQKKRTRGFLATELLIVRVVSVMLMLHFIEASIWAGFYWISNIFHELETAIYFSITSYTTVGYGDVICPHLGACWDQLKPLSGF